MEGRVNFVCESDAIELVHVLVKVQPVGWLVGWLMSFTLTPRSKATCRLPQLYKSAYVHVECSTS
jgi:hypothetical protein